MNIKINTHFVYPPIPSRQYDWCAWFDYDGEEAGKYGYGPTEAEAITALIGHHGDDYALKIRNACNAHDELVAALIGLHELIECVGYDSRKHQPLIDNASAVLAKVQS